MEPAAVWSGVRGGLSMCILDPEFGPLLVTALDVLNPLSGRQLPLAGPEQSQLS